MTDCNTISDLDTLTRCRARSAGTARHPQPGALSVGRASSGSTGHEGTHREAHARAACRSGRHHERMDERFLAEPRLGSAARARVIGSQIARRARLGYALCRQNISDVSDESRRGRARPRGACRVAGGGSREDGRANWVSAHARTRSAVLESWVRAHPSKGSVRLAGGPL